MQVSDKFVVFGGREEYQRIKVGENNLLIPVYPNSSSGLHLPLVGESILGLRFYYPDMNNVSPKPADVLKGLLNMIGGTDCMMEEELCQNNRGQSFSVVKQRLGSSETVNTLYLGEGNISQFAAFSIKNGMNRVVADQLTQRYGIKFGER